MPDIIDPKPAGAAVNAQGTDVAVPAKPAETVVSKQGADIAVPPKPTGTVVTPPGPDAAVSARNESWLAKNTGPMLAIGTVILTFFMFGYFVYVAKTPSRESVELRSALKSLADAEAAFNRISSSKAEKKEPGRMDEQRKERDRLKLQVANAREAAEDAKERRAMVKDFVLYILGVLSSALTTIFGYYFGSSKGSSDKSTALNAIAVKSQQ